MNEAGELVMGLVICATVVAASHWEIEIHFHHYSNPSGQNRKEECCVDQCVCNVEFRICLRPGNYDNDNNRCPYNDFEKTTSMYTLANFITFNDTINDLENPIIFTSGGKLEEVPASGLLLYVRVRDVDSSTDTMLVDRLFANTEGIGSSTNSTLLTGVFGNVELIISYDVRCQQNYYANNCSTHCQPSDDGRGHYNCDPSNGNKICLPGYQNPQTNCTQVACELVCTGEGGSCSESGECVCSQGWGGEDCGQAQCADNCHPVGGYCDQPGECVCNTHWNGTNCDQFLCHPDCSTVGGTCVMAGGCDCLPDYTGEYCETDLNPCSHLTPCENGGTCSNGDPNQYSCSCPSGYTGKHCETMATIAVMLATPSQTLQQDSLPVGAIIGGTVGVVVFVTLLFLATVSMLVLLIRRRAGTKVELSGSGDTGGIQSYPEENIYTLSSDEPMSGLGNPMYDSIVLNQQRQPAAGGELITVDNVSSSVPAPYESFVPTNCKPAHLDHFSAIANEEEAGKEPFERVVDNDLYALSTPGEIDQSMATGLQAQSSNGYAYVTWHTRHH